jgi:hypothetical protein
MTAASTPLWSRFMTQVWRSTWGWDAMRREGRITGCGSAGVLGDESLNGVRAEPSAGSGREQRLFSEARPVL